MPRRSGERVSIMFFSAYTIYRATLSLLRVRVHAITAGCQIKKKKTPCLLPSAAVPQGLDEKNPDAHAIPVDPAGPAAPPRAAQARRGRACLRRGAFRLPQGGRWPMREAALRTKKLTPHGRSQCAWRLQEDAGALERPGRTEGSRSCRLTCEHHLFRAL